MYTESIPEELKLIPRFASSVFGSFLDTEKREEEKGDEDALTAQPVR